MGKKLYKNSECEKCGTWLENVKLKNSPLDGKEYIYCRECYAKEFKQSKEVNGK